MYINTVLERSEMERVIPVLRQTLLKYQTIMWLHEMAGFVCFIYLFIIRRILML